MPFNNIMLDLCVFPTKKSMFHRQFHFILIPIELDGKFKAERG